MMLAGVALIGVALAFVLIELNQRRHRRKCRRIYPGGPS